MTSARIICTECLQESARWMLKGEGVAVFVLFWPHTDAQQRGCEALDMSATEGQDRQIRWEVKRCRHCYSDVRWMDERLGWREWQREGEDRGSERLKSGVVQTKYSECSCLSHFWNFMDTVKRGKGSVNSQNKGGVRCTFTRYLAGRKKVISTGHFKCLVLI